MKKKEMIPLTYQENKSYENQKVCYICKTGFSTDGNNKEYHKVRDHCHFTEKYRGAAHNTCDLRYKIPKKFKWFFIMVQIMTIILLLKS